MDLFGIREYKAQIVSLEHEKKNLEEKVKELYTKLAQQDYEIKRLTKDITIKDSLIKENMPFWNRDFAPIHENFENYKKSWNKWPPELHSSLPQIQRQERACQKVYTPLSIEFDYGTFRGTENDYITTLVNCRCTDYQRRQLPCKHMYRLAHELDVFMLENVEYVPDPSQIMRISDIKPLIKQMTATQLEYFQLLLANGSLIELRSNTAIKYFINQKLAISVNNPKNLLFSFTKDDLISRLPANTKLRKSIKKSEIIELICCEFPEVIDSLNKVYIEIAVNPYYEHIQSQIENYVSINIK